MYCRVRNARNLLHHVALNELSAMKFEEQWSTVAVSLVKLGSCHEDILEYKTADLDPQMTQKCTYEVKLQSMLEQCAKMEVIMRRTYSEFHQTF